jgi:ankyrin repeat protein
MNKEEANQKILKMMNKDDSLSEDESQLFKKLIYHCNLNTENEHGWTPLMYTLLFNKTKNLHLAKEQLGYLIKHSDLTIQSKDGWTPLMYALRYNQYEKLNFTKEQFDYFIEHSDLTIQSQDGWIPLMFAFKYNQSENLQITKKQFQVMYDALNKEQQQNTFKVLIVVNHKYSHQYVEEINRLLYDLQFQPNEETNIWLQENQYPDILPMIEKRDLLFQLNKNIRFVENNRKIAIMKI